MLHQGIAVSCMALTAAITRVIDGSICMVRSWWWCMDYNRVSIWMVDHSRNEHYS